VIAARYSVFGSANFPLPWANIPAWRTMGAALSWRGRQGMPVIPKPKPLPIGLVIHSQDVKSELQRLRFSRSRGGRAGARRTTSGFDKYYTKRVNDLSQRRLRAEEIPISDGPKFEDCQSTMRCAPNIATVSLFHSELFQKSSSRGSGSKPYHRGGVGGKQNYLFVDLHVLDTCFTLFTFRLGCDAAPVLAELALSPDPPEVVSVIWTL
jgi:hypothetical protein